MKTEGRREATQLRKEGGRRRRGQKRRRRRRRRRKRKLCYLSLEIVTEEERGKGEMGGVHVLTWHLPLPPLLPLLLPFRRTP